VELVEEEGTILEVRGNECKAGRKYAEEEFKNPRRTVTTTVKVKGGVLPVLPVVSADPLPKGRVREAVRELSRLVVEAPVEEGQVVCEDLLGLGVKVIASRRLERKGAGRQ
jgi:CxxC motif-containing protein